MSFVAIKSKFHVGLNGVGFILQGAPDRPGYKQGQAPIYNQRFGEGDRSYNDLSAWWYFVQTDWSGGLKNSVAWSDDAKYYYETNIDAWSEVGAIKLTREQYPAGAGGDNDFTYDVICGIVGELASTSYKFVGTANEADDRPHVYRAALGEDETWTDISTTVIGTSQNVIAQLSTRLGVLWASTVGTGATYVVITYNGTSWVDQSAIIYNGGATISFQPASSRCHVDYNGVMYVFVDDSSNNRYALVKTTTQEPTLAANWSKVFEITSNNGIPVACAGYNGNIYYLTDHGTYLEFWQYNIAANTNVLVRRFNNTTSVGWGTGDKWIVEMNGKLIITIPVNEIWELNGSDLTRIFVKDEFKRDSGGSEIDSYLLYGCVIQDNKAWWGNLMYNGTNFYNTWKNDGDSTSARAYPLFADSSLRIWETHTEDTSVIWSVNLNGSAYKGTTDKNFLVFSNFDLLSGVEKLAYSVTILFKPLASGQSIVVEYLLGEFTTSASWTTLGTASFALDGATPRSKTFLFPVATIFNKIWFRVKLVGGGSNTPTMNDLVMEYLPVPTQKKDWALNINCADDLRRLDGQLVSTVGRELKAMLEAAWWTKSVLDFQDLDYATTLLNGALNNSATTITVDDTADFPEQGRIRIDDEEIIYTGKTPTTFTGCTRGARSTRASAHSDDSVVNNAYKVIITDYGSNAPILLEDKEIEYTVGLRLREV